MKISLVQLLIGIIIVAGITFGIAKYLDEDTIIYQTEYQQEKIDSLSTALQNMYVREDDLLDSLSNTTEGFRERLRRSKDEIASLTRVKGHLNLKIDSLQDKNAVEIVSAGVLSKFSRRATISDSGMVMYGKTDSNSNFLSKNSKNIERLKESEHLEGLNRLSVEERPGFKRLLYSTTTFGDSLLSIYSEAGVRSDSLVLRRPVVTQLRPVRLDVALTISDDRRRVTSLVTSPDFDSLKVQAFTTIKPLNKFPWRWVALGTGFVLGVIVK